MAWERPGQEVTGLISRVSDLSHRTGPHTQFNALLFFT